MVTRVYPSQEELRRILDYDSETGVFTWKLRTVTHWRDGRFNKIFAGKIAGSCSKYRSIQINGLSYDEHRLAYIYVHGDIPSYMEIDHKNRNILDNRIENLRCASSGMNRINTDNHPRNTSGVVGVRYDETHTGWFVWIKKEYVGRFKDFTDAVQARYDAEVKYGFTEYNPNSTAYQYLRRKQWT